MGSYRSDKSILGREKIQNTGTNELGMGIWIYIEYHHSKVYEVQMVLLCQQVKQKNGIKHYCVSTSKACVVDKGGHYLFI